MEAHGNAESRHHRQRRYPADHLLRHALAQEQDDQRTQRRKGNKSQAKLNME